MRIGELPERTGASPRSLRYYEEQGMLSSSTGNDDFPNGSTPADRTTRLPSRGPPGRERVVRGAGALLGRSSGAEDVSAGTGIKLRGRRRGRIPRPWRRR
ncbi:MerR family DNA-binding transcriptional regulator [Saccharothrix yanglingensis]|uniref:MerR family DNA-binding transcriptional regulator n=1 Tax=Saccharothrix yanglingensis TaxID=659496 RepID=UPI003526F1C2